MIRWLFENLNFPFKWKIVECVQRCIFNLWNVYQFFEYVVLISQSRGVNPADHPRSQRWKHLLFSLMKTSQFQQLLMKVEKWALGRSQHLQALIARYRSFHDVQFFKPPAPAKTICFRVMRPSVRPSLHPSAIHMVVLCFRDISSICWWIFAKLLSLVYLGTQMTWLRFWVKRSKFKVTPSRRRCTALDATVECYFF